MLGLIAFTLLFLEDRSLAFFSRVSDAVSYDYHRMHLLFEFGHFLILFMALAFMIICLTLDTFVKVIERRWKRLTDRSADVHLKEWLHHLATLANANASGVFGSMPVLTTTEPSAASPAAALGSHALDRKLERLSKSTKFSPTKIRSTSPPKAFKPEDGGALEGDVRRVGGARVVSAVDRCRRAPSRSAAPAARERDRQPWSVQSWIDGVWRGSAYVTTRRSYKFYHDAMYYVFEAEFKLRHRLKKDFDFAGKQGPLKRSLHEHIAEVVEVRTAAWISSSSYPSSSSSSTKSAGPTAAMAATAAAAARRRRRQRWRPPPGGRRVVERVVGPHRHHPPRCLRARYDVRERRGGATAYWPYPASDAHARDVYWRAVAPRDRHRRPPPLRARPSRSRCSRSTRAMMRTSPPSATAARAPTASTASTMCSPTSPKPT